MIVPVRGDDTGLLERLRVLRTAEQVPLVGDDRWPQAQWDAVRAVAATTATPPGAAWATLTSGSSGAPRIVLRTAESWAASFAAVARLLDAGPDDAVLLPAPPSASLTLFSLAHALDGGPRPLLDPADRADATCLHGTPQALRSVLDAGPLPRLRAALVGGSHLDDALRTRAEEAGIRVAAYYGAAELSFVAVDEGDGLRAFPGAELTVRDGELWVRSPFVALGYAGSDGPLRRDGEWATVGDRAELVDGRLRLLGRADDAILSASATIVPEEVEAVIRSVPGVRDVVVFGLPQPRVGALVAAFVELDGPPPVGLRTAVAAQLAPAHRPRQWFAGELPRTAGGKPARAEAVRRAVAGEVDRLVL
ncbi:class I adenylate-forming enzyme family protein [Microbacterium capsulatum]|uniref:Class I adenylate-forming enzyme family protein n=1 Tax=Microbacterium capsulatum TaxID=3041921 RepID=A0ABU0XBT2_9MICO|nr:class I adenylate-forming enzyme family protein [Microbacterium sp. ASV81]MDQ4212556.1 class I adenylate-forming enzyme family protein [Microbacterium sp. ASV81]